MLRSELENKMKNAGIRSMVIVLHKDDPLGACVELKSGILYDMYTGRRVDRKVDIWGYIRYEDGKPVRYPFAQ